MKIELETPYNLGEEKTLRFVDKETNRHIKGKIDEIQIKVIESPLPEVWEPIYKVKYQMGWPIGKSGETAMFLFEPEDVIPNEPSNLEAYTTEQLLEELDRRKARL